MRWSQPKAEVKTLYLVTYVHSQRRTAVPLPGRKTSERLVTSSLSEGHAWKEI